MHINMVLRAITPDIIRLAEPGMWMGVDRGAYEMVKHGIDFTIAVGDFDSVSQAEYVAIRTHSDVHKLPKNKDMSDFEYALKVAKERQATSIDVYGALGGRIDHELMNIHALMHPDFLDMKIRLINDQNLIEALNVGETTIYHTRSMTYVSFVPMVDKTTVSLRGLKYELNEHTLNFGETLTVSNEFVTSSAVVVTDHPLFVIQSKD